MVSQKTAWIILVFVVGLAAVIRFAGLTQNPPSLNWDEVSHGYNAYSLLHTGRDQWGSAFPIFNFRAYGDYPTTLNLYLTVPAIALLGPTDFALRFPHALIGVLGVLLIYIFAVRWQKDRLFALICAFVFAFSPWTFFLSRQVLQANWSIFLLTLGLALFFSGHFRASVLAWGLSLFAYHNTRIFTPLLLLLILASYPAIRYQRKLALLVVSVIIASLGILWLSQSRARTSWVGILDTGAVAQIEQQRNHSTLPPFFARLVYNRPAYFVATLTKNYLGYFSPRFLFLDGGTQYQFSLPGFGVLNPVLLPFFYFGVYLLWRRKSWLFLGWLLVSPLPAAITRDQFAVVRATAMTPVVIVAAALGLAVGLRYLRGLLLPAFTVILLAVYIYFAYSYSSIYLTKYPWLYSQSWQFGNQAMVKLARQYFSEYDQIIITKKYGEPHEFILWYWPWNPAAYQTDPSLSTNYHDHWYWVDGFSKFRFVDDWEMPQLVKSLPVDKKFLIFSSPENQVSANRIDQINFLDGKPAYLVSAK